jgi:hypothetical protein
LLLISVVVLAALFGGAGLYWRWTGSPRYALQRLALALKTRDMDQLYKYVDLKAILNNVLESSDLNPGEGGPEADRWKRHSREMARRFARLLLPKLFDSYEKEIKEGLSKYLANLDNTQILAIAAAASTARIEVRGEEALVTLVNPKNQEKFHFCMERQAQTGTWRIVSVDYQDLKKFLKHPS